VLTIIPSSVTLEYYLLASTRMHPPWRLIKVLLLTPLIYGIYCIGKQVIFENFLNSLYITFDDFPRDYSKALIASVSDNSPLHYDYSVFSAFNSTSTIPPKIHFIWFKDLYETHADRTEIPSVGSKAPEYCRKSNPDFTINVWNATGARNLLEQSYAWFLPTYDSYKHPIQRVDAFKYFVLWHFGGIYMDLDISCRRSLAPLLEFPAWFPRASPLGVNNDLMASRAKHPLVGEMIQSLKPRNKNLLFPYVTVFWSTGPQFTSDILKRWYNEHTRRRLVKGLSIIRPGKLKAT
jgi:mannosyltransferase OCH1-like enzyme